MSIGKATLGHPGLKLGELIAEKKLQIVDVANQLGVTRTALSRVVNGRAAVSVEMARRLEAWGSVSAEEWLLAQLHYDLALSRKMAKIKVERCK